MAESKTDRQQADTVRTTDQPGHRQVDPGTSTELQALRALIVRAVEAHDLDRPDGTLLVAEVEAALSAPLTDNVRARLGTARDIAARIPVPQVVVAIDGIVSGVDG
ncbi:hypothetical protein [Umezawaea sp. Da 62-37]|uniref:hypothetical protein n=1 Tax=Umezawaea sp. Da 62-37 TaxID=3075927 RepID=UPI0028F6F1AC|nr:hypothetical protein [Umezawaea sp. Da 62-37]WNV90600.1 hypothetical protein RM788_20640 [Umezawaea sp. Da 62-37]